VNEDFQLLEVFLEMMAGERQASKNTLESYERDIRDCAAFFHAKRKTSLQHAAPDDVRAYLRHLHQKEISVGTQARRLSALRQFFLFIKSEKYREDNPTALIDAPGKGRSLPKALTQQEITALLEAAYANDTPEGLRLFAIVELLYASGMRISELLGLPLNALQFAAKQKALRPYLIVKGKGNKERLVPLNPSAIGALEAYLGIRPYFLKATKESPYLFPIDPKGRGVDNRGKGHMTRQRLGQILKELAVEAGILPSRVSPHVLRHSFATHLLQGGADLRIVQELMGHASIVSTQIYTLIADKQMQQLVFDHHPLAKKNA
jgi:integrase/recombinase XerD